MASESPKPPAKDKPYYTTRESSRRNPMLIQSRLIKPKAEYRWYINRPWRPPCMLPWQITTDPEDPIAHIPVGSRFCCIPRSYTGRNSGLCADSTRFRSYDAVKAHVRTVHTYKGKPFRPLRWGVGINKITEYYQTIRELNDHSYVRPETRPPRRGELTMAREFSTRERAGK
ncbi:hypothetical protein B0T16DRAFT_452403 [Cercophora newfieldiana]|uniref:Uncharacterized protein n=1 Tax=Cercophora newfieldiana TaxID=92897 RepID=A0AA39YT02_9PEZI|nr:hypothetical protein B0T16DRAFT_452403 [Cercophora newfieldiana]